MKLKSKPNLDKFRLHATLQPTAIINHEKIEVWVRDTSNGKQVYHHIIEREDEPTSEWYQRF